MKVHMLKYSCWCMILLFSYQQNLFGQNQAPYSISSITPPSPSAYELGKYGQTPVGLFSGTIAPSIPLYEFHTRNLSVPITLNYSSNGIKVDELGSTVGLGWSLIVGGVISCIVRDLPDNNRNQYLPDEIIHRPNGIHSTEALAYFNNAANNADIDTETDLFMFNFNGHSGKFVFDNDHKIVMIPKQDIKIETIAESTNDGFKITTADGVVYTFLEKETSTNRASGAGHTLPEIPHPTAWYLSTITHPNGDAVTFVYEYEGYGYVTSQQQTLISTPMQTGCPDAPMHGASNVITPNHQL